MTLKIVTVVGARPQFIKAAPVSDVMRKMGQNEILVHTGQHYDFNMSGKFFEELDIPKPLINLEVGSGTHGKQTGQMLIEIEQVLLDTQPDLVIVYGDTNSTLAGALAAVKLNIPVAHIESGLRSFNKTMPEEHNRIMTDHISSMLFCPTDQAVKQLANEGITSNVYCVGDTMYDATIKFSSIAKEKSQFLETHQLKPKEYVLATVHRPYNVDDPETLLNILSAFSNIDYKIVFPVHPRTRSKMSEILDMPKSGNMLLIDPLGYMDMLVAEQNAQFILTDSGGIQKEAYFLEVPCITLRIETEWIETVESGWNYLLGRDFHKIPQIIKTWTPPPKPSNTVFGDGFASESIVQKICDILLN